MFKNLLRGIWCLLTPHLQSTLPGVGVVRYCHPFREVSFRPELPGAMAHRVPSGDDDCVRRIAECTEPLSAMAILRESQRAAQESVQS